MPRLSDYFAVIGLLSAALGATPARDFKAVSVVRELGAHPGGRGSNAISDLDQVAPAAPSVADPPPATQGVPAATAPADVRLDVVRRLLRSSKYADAQMVAEGLLKTNPSSLRAKFYLGLTLHKQKLYARARPYLEAAAAAPASFPEGPHAIHYVGWCAYYLGDLPAARAAFTQHVNAFPNYDDTHFGLGLVALDEDQLAEAETSFRTALKLLVEQNGLPRERAKNLARLGDVLLRQERQGEAEMCYREAVALWRDHHEAWAKLARILDRQQHFEEAAAARAEQQAAIDRMKGEGIPWRP